MPVSLRRSFYFALGVVSLGSRPFLFVRLGFIWDGQFLLREPSNICDYLSEWSMGS
jgi:hypothetical protein